MGRSPMSLLNPPLQKAKGMVRKNSAFRFAASDYLLGLASDSGRTLWTRKEAIKELLRRGDGAPAGILMAMAQEDEAAVKVYALAKLGQLEHPGACEAAMRSLADRDPFVREVAASCLARVGDRRSILSLQGLRLDQNNHVRSEAVQALAFIQKRHSCSLGESLV